MRKKIINFASVFIFMLLFVTSSVKADSIQTKRLWGDDRYATNLNIINEGWKSSDYAVVVSGDNFPDALSAAPLARKYNAPIFLAYSTSLGNDVQYKLKELGVKNVFIVGGTGVLSFNIEVQLKNLGISYERIAGDNRDLTSLAVANKIGTSNGVIVTTDNDYTDALSIAPIAGKLQMPIILTQKDSLDSMQKKFISTNSIPKTYVLGGQDIISENVASKFPNVQRIEGDDKYIRNFNIITSFSNDIDFNNVILASANNFPDALSGSAFAALNGNPIILMGNSSKYYVSDLISYKGTKNVYTLGGQASITDDVLNDTVNKSNALNTITSKVKINSNLRLGVISNIYNQNGSKYYTVVVYEKRNDKWFDGFYKYIFLVDIQTGDAYKLETSTKEISPLENMEI